MEENLLTYLTSSEEEGRELKTILRSRLALSRALVVKLKQQQKILVNGQPVYTNYRMQPGDLVEVDLELLEENMIIPEAIPLEIVYEDNELLVINKPPGMSVHPARRDQTGTLANAVTFYWQERGENNLFRPVNRLDLDTSGLVLIAGSKFAHQRFFEQQKRGELERQYCAIVEGTMTKDTGRIDQPIIRLGDRSRKRGVDPSGQKAITNYRVVQRFKEHTLVSLRLETGRTHQIRVHLSYLGHPICGDTLYGQPSPLIGRQALHARTLTLTHPRTAARLTITAPLPEDMREMIEHLLAHHQQVIE